MRFKPVEIVIDFETALTDGTPSTEYYRDDFRAISCAFAWVGESGQVATDYVVGEENIAARLEEIRAGSIPVISHNVQFEYGVCLYRFPGMEVILKICTMRLVQVSDNGGKIGQYDAKPVLSYDEMLDAAEAGEPEEEVKPKMGLSLVGGASRWLDKEWQNHKEPFHKLIRERSGCKRGKEGQNLHFLTAEELKAYNVADAIVTLKLYLRLVALFIAEKYDWRLDHSLYFESAKRISRAKGEGIPVDRERLKLVVEKVRAEVQFIEDTFRAKFLVSILELEQAACEVWCGDLKTEKGREKRRNTIEPEQFLFKVGSTVQLAALFVNKLGITPKFWTKESKASKAKRKKDPSLPEFIPKPSFKSAHISTYGEGGEILKKRRKRLLVLKQTESLLALSEYDGKWHVDLKACGTTTGRFAGGSANG